MLEDAKKIEAVLFPASKLTSFGDVVRRRSEIQRVKDISVGLHVVVYTERVKDSRSIGAKPLLPRHCSRATQRLAISPSRFKHSVG